MELCMLAPCVNSNQHSLSALSVAVIMLKCFSINSYPFTKSLLSKSLALQNDSCLLKKT